MTQRAARRSLSILIPAFNQGEEAAATLCQIALQVDTWQAELEVILSDNFSDPEQFALVNDLGGIYPWLKIYRQDHNLGFMGNVGFLAQRAQLDYSLILGCGDQVDLAGLSEVLTRVEGLCLEPSIIVAGVSSHLNLSDRHMAKIQNPKIDARNWFSRWVPYQEAIPGQIYKTKLLKDFWMINWKTGNTWPHIEMAFRVLNQEEVLIVKTNVALVSMFQNTTAWYFRPGTNTSALLQHLGLLFCNLRHGLGVWTKIGVLVSLGLFRAAGQDIQALILKIRSPS